MKRFLVKFIRSASSEEKKRWEAENESKKAAMVQSVMRAWGQWVQDNQQAIVDFGSPLGKTKRINKSGISEIENKDTAYVIVQAESHEAAAKLFIDHPHFSIFPGDSVEVMECLPMPTA